jgi:predicted TIM-barrel fold metal-dependent hydrolase
MKVVDADAHVEENEAIWEYLDPEFRAQRPVPLKLPEGLAGYGRFNAVWLIEGQVHPKLSGRGWHIMSTPLTSVNAQAKPMSVGAQDMTDVPARLADMDRFGIHYQVVYPTLFLTTLADDTRLERALCQAYNRFMGQACEPSGGRIRFAAVLPLRNMDDAVQVAREAKELGAVSTMVPGVVWDTPLSDPSYYPLYEELSRLQLPLGIHVAWGSPTLSSLVSDFANNFLSFMVPVQAGFYSLMMGGIYERFPDLKVAFLEAGCEWLPYVINQLDRSYALVRGALRRKPSEYLRQGNIYVSCESEEDVPYVLQYISEDQMLIASDYPHFDPSSEADMVRNLESHQTRLSPEVRAKILSANPIRLYNLPA